MSGAVVEQSSVRTLQCFPAVTFCVRYKPCFDRTSDGSNKASMGVQETSVLCGFISTVQLLACYNSTNQKQLRQKALQGTLSGSNTQNSPWKDLKSRATLHREVPVKSNSA